MLVEGSSLLTRWLGTGDSSFQGGLKPHGCISTVRADLGQGEGSERPTIDHWPQSLCRRELVLEPKYSASPSKRGSAPGYRDNPPTKHLFHLTRSLT